MTRWLLAVPSSTAYCERELSHDTARPKAAVPLTSQHVRKQALPWAPLRHVLCLLRRSNVSCARRIALVPYATASLALQMLPVAVRRLSAQAQAR